MRGVGLDRTATLARLADETFDVVVVGGGITGAGCALDAVSRGLRTALVERDDQRALAAHAPPPGHRRSASA